MHLCHYYMAIRVKGICIMISKQITPPCFPNCLWSKILRNKYLGSKPLVQNIATPKLVTTREYLWNNYLPRITNIQLLLLKDLGHRRLYMYIAVHKLKGYNHIAHLKRRDIPEASENKNNKILLKTEI
ncbi:hypothetical protein ACJX0J_008906, partial [Zea mays]